MSQQTITINGTTYDAHTGLPVGRVTQNDSVAHFTTPESNSSSIVHQQIQKSHTLNRRVVKKAVTSAEVATPNAPKLVQKSSAITKFAKHPSGITPRRRVMSDIGPSVHPMVKKAHEQMMSTPSKTAPKPSAIIKQEAVINAMHATSSRKASHKLVKATPNKAHRILSVASASLALLLLGGYFTYLNMPNLSVRVAAVQAGINASYPSYRPDGYTLNGPVAYNDGEVSMKFAANAGPQNFTITQEKTTWDSTAVKENFVDKKWGDNIDIVTERGLTIYRKDGNAVWVNGGILYTINGDAPLTPSQVRGIATSL